jgi:hypothetical protein
VPRKESPRLEAAHAGVAERAAFRGEEVAADVILVAKGAGDGNGVAEEAADVIRVAEEGEEVAAGVIRVEEADVDVTRVAEGGEKA